MKDLGVVNIMLGIKITRTYNGLILSHFYYVEEILDKFSKGSKNTKKTPMDISIHLSKK
jgi:hypothetical protein